jgi:hypothetical protein
VLRTQSPDPVFMGYRQLFRVQDSPGHGSTLGASSRAMFLLGVPGHGGLVLDLCLYLYLSPLCPSPLVLSRDQTAAWMFPRIPD